MLEILTEKPLTLLLAGGLPFAILLMIGLSTGKRAILIAAAAIFAVTCVLLVVERMVETQQEAVRRTLREIAATVARRDVDALLTYVHPSADSIRQTVISHFETYAPQSARINRVIEIIPTSPDSARVRFTARVEVPDQTAMAYVIADMRKEGDQWKVTAYTVRPFQEAFMEKKEDLSEPLPPSAY